MAAKKDTTAKAPSMKVKKGDTVVVLAGRDKGAKGRGSAAHPEREKGARGGAPSMKLERGATVVVLAGRDKGAKGRVIAAYPKLQKVLVEGVGRGKKHTRISTSQRGGQRGGVRRRG